MRALHVETGPKSVMDYFGALESNFLTELLLHGKLYVFCSYL